MPISDIPILSMLRTRMQWHQERQHLLAENVANADTPNYRAATSRRPISSAAISLARTEAGQIAGWAVPGSPRMAIATTKCARAATP
jgi:flagellar basal-body rod protein FlgB